MLHVFLKFDLFSSKQAFTWSDFDQAVDNE